MPCSCRGRRASVSSNSPSSSRRAGCAKTLRPRPSPPAATALSCKLFASGTHPDFQLLLPEALEAAGPRGPGPAVTRSPTPRPARPSRASEIKVEAVRSLLAFAQATSARGRAKVAVIFPAEALNGVAANALLKTLEEPSGLLRFALASARQRRAAADHPQPLPARCRWPCPSVAPRSAWLASKGVEGAEGPAGRDGRPAAAGAGVVRQPGLSDAAWQALPEARRAGRGGRPCRSWAPPRVIDALAAPVP